MEWQVMVALILAIPIVLFVPALIWMAMVSGLYQVVRDRMHRRAVVSRRRRAARLAEERVIS
ncbi:MAG: hypothetical protein V1691_04230 [Chloroflexota bacterium]